MAQFKYLLFDADETLLDFKKSESNGLEVTFREMGYEATAEIIDEYHRYNAGLWKALERGEITKIQLKTERFRHVVDIFGLEGVDPEYMGDRYAYNLGLGAFLLPGALDVVVELEDKYQLSIVTNGIASVQHARLRDSGLQDHFSHIFISDEMGVQKPDVRFFEIVLDTLGAKPEECLVIGDSLTSDMMGAHNAGIPKCWINRTGAQRPPLDYHIEYEIHDIQELLQIV